MCIRDSFKWVPGVAGSRRTLYDVFVYYLFLIFMFLAVVSPGLNADKSSLWYHPAVDAFQQTMLQVGQATGLSWFSPDNVGTFQIVNFYFLIPAVFFLCLDGLGDKTIFLAARWEQYLLPIVFFIVFPIFTPEHAVVNLSLIHI